MTRARQQVGRRGEDLVARRLAAGGWRVLARNCRVRALRGELDIVAMDGATLVFLEVKTMRAEARSGPVSPAEMVDRRKQRRIRTLGGAWLRENARTLPPRAGLRFDVVALRMDPAGRPVDWNHIRAAF